MAFASLSSSAAAASPLLRPVSGRPWRLLPQSSPSPPSSYSSSSSLTNPRAAHHHHRLPRFLRAAQSPVPEPPPPEDPISDRTLRLKLPSNCAGSREEAVEICRCLTGVAHACQTIEDFQLTGAPNGMELRLFMPNDLSVSQMPCHPYVMNHNCETTVLQIGKSPGPLKC